MKKWLFTSESVTEGHPDKMCDQISDGILDAILEQDPDARVACETVTKTGFVLVAGEISTECYIDIPQIVRNTNKKLSVTTVQNTALITKHVPSSPQLKSSLRTLPWVLIKQMNTKRTIMTKMT